MIAGFDAVLLTADISGEATSSQVERRNRAEFLVGAMWGARITARLMWTVLAGQWVVSTTVNTIRSWRD